MKKAMLVTLVLIALVLAACGNEKPAPTTEPTILFIPGVEDSIFDDPTIGGEIGELPQPTTPNPGATEPTGNVPAPTQPTQPVAPTLPTDPVEPGQPTQPVTPTQPTQPEDPQNPEDPADTTRPTTPVVDPTQPTEPEATQPVYDIIDYASLTYEQWVALPVEQAQNVVLSLKTTADYDAFFAWYNKALEDYKAAHPGIEVGNGPIDMNELLGNKGN